MHARSIADCLLCTSQLASAIHMKDCASNSRRAFATAAIVLESILAQQYPNRGLVS